MEEDPGARTTKETYKGCEILLTPIQQNDGNWVCEYVVIELVITESPYIRGQTDKSFPSPTVARAAALLLAITILDSRSGTADTDFHVSPLWNTTRIESTYDGKAIKLRSGQQDDGTWICQYSILGFGPTRESNLIAYPRGSFSTRDEAEAAALEVAQGEIDSDVPQSFFN